MPPSVSEVEVPLPSERGTKAAHWLETQGLIPRVPQIRSSDYELSLANPFAYYLTRRLGLMSRFEYSAALSRGSWFHTWLEHDTFGPPPISFSKDPLSLLEDRNAELREICASCGIVGDRLRECLDRERKDALVSRAWYNASAGVNIGPQYGTWRDFLQKPYWRIVARELPISLPWKKFTLGGRLDLLLYHAGHNVLWPLDMKTCSGSPKNRAAVCPIEFQTQHYLYMVRELLQDPAWRRTHKLPDDVRLQGMIHVIIQKPTIIMGQPDRDYTLVDKVLKSGPRKGQTISEKVYRGEPVLENYVQRVSDWMLGLNDYAHLLPERNADPVVNISFTQASILDGEGEHSYHARLHHISELASRTAIPSNFLTSAHSSRSMGGGLTVWGEFAVTPVRDWPEIITRRNLMVRLPEEEPADVQEESPS